VSGLQATASTSCAAWPDATVRSIAPWVRLLDQDGDLVGVARLQDASGVLHPSVVLM
jgi:hypothetical protein